MREPSEMSAEFVFHDQNDSRMFPTSSIGNFRLEYRRRPSDGSDVGSLLKDRVEERLRVLKLNPFEAARAVGLERNFINDIRNDKKTSVRGQNLLLLAKALACSPNYLISADADAPDDSDLGAGVGEEPPIDLTADQVEVPEHDIRLSGGPGAIAGDEPAIDVWSFSRRYLEGFLGLKAGSLAVVRVIGDSMAPTIMSGDRVLIDHSDKTIGNGGVFAAWYDDGTVVKRFQIDDTPAGRRILMLSDNPSQKPQTLLPDRIIIIGRVVWYARRL